MSGATQINEETPLKALFEARSDGEFPFVSFRALEGDKVPALEVDLICMSKAKLAEGNEGTTDADCEIVSVNAKTFKGSEPPHPVSMARNSKVLSGNKTLPGGTRAVYSAEQWCESVLHWYGGGETAPYVMLEPKATVSA
jgi:hypothetical protein